VSTRNRPAPAALLLGLLSGVLAMVLVLPTAIPLTMRLSTAEQALAVREAQRAASFAASVVLDGGELPAGTAQHLQVEYLSVVAAEGHSLYEEGVAPPAEIAESACGRADLASVQQSEDGNRWATACVNANGTHVLAAFRPKLGASREVALVVFSVAIVVGIVTALAVLRLLAPLSRISAALDRVGAGERGVRLDESTGLSELDALVARLNAAARAMEGREEAIVARMNVVQEMARLVAHEVRNPLQSLELLTSLIVSEEDEKEREELARSIHQEIRGLDMVVTRLLKEGTSSGKMRLQRQSGTVEPLIKQVFALRGPEAKRQGISLELGPIEAADVDMDPALLGRSIENLVLNAMQAVPPKRGRIRVSVTTDESDLCITVEDNGPGVPESFGDEIYAPNVSGRTGGTGLGLSLVKGVIEAHGGTIRHDRGPLGGARFLARIPLREVPRVS
jgi:signal transduction histidine kinase